MSTVLLAVHVVAGTLGLAVGPVALLARKRRGLHTRAGLVYQVLVAVMTSTALVLALLDVAGLWWLGLIAVATEAAALAGWRERRLHRPGWLPRHVRYMAGSYISFVTAALVVNWSHPAAWVLPTLVGTPLIERTLRRLPGAPRATVDREGPDAEVVGVRP